MKLLHMIMIVLTLVGGINWTLFGFVGVNLFTVFGGPLTTILYLLTTVSTLYIVFPHFIKTLQPA